MKSIIKPILKSKIKVKIATLSLILAIILSSIGCGKVDKIEIIEETEEQEETIEQTQNETTKQDENVGQYRTLEQLRSVELKTYSTTFLEQGKRNIYNFANEEDILQISYEFKYAIEDYFRGCGASFWTSEKDEQFFPEDIEYLVTAIAYKESSYRCNVINELGCGGLTGLNKKELLETLQNQWLVKNIWGNNIPYVNCNSEEVDIFNPTTCIEYTYYNIGYNLANRLKLDKEFTYKGERRKLSEVIDYSKEDMFDRLIAASHLFGLNNVVTAAFGDKFDKDGNKIDVNQYLYSDYVEDVLAKKYELKNTYENKYSK